MKSSKSIKRWGICRALKVNLRRAVFGDATSAKGRDQGNPQSCELEVELQRVQFGSDTDR
jgi:hypothetical protein